MPLVVESWPCFDGGKAQQGSERHGIKDDVSTRISLSLWLTERDDASSEMEEEGMTGAITS